MKTFNVSGVDASGNPIISDNGNASVDINTVVKWQITQNTLSAIDIEIPTTPGIWSSPPAPYPVGTTEPYTQWRGTVGNFPGDEENYSVGTTLKSGQRTQFHDPKISINR